MSTDLSKSTEVLSEQQATLDNNVDSIETTVSQQTVEPSPSFGGWFSSMVQSAKDTVNKSKLNEIGNTVNEIGSLGTGDINELGEIETNQINEQSSKASIIKSESVEMIREDNVAPLTKAVEGEDEDEPQLFNMETINTWTNLLTDRAKSTISMVKDTLVESIFINREYLVDELDEDPFVLKDGQIVPIEGWKQLLYELQTNPDTYCREPNGPPEDYDLWLTKFNLINYQKQMEILLETVPEIKKLHQGLVPKELSESDFWHRYYYKVFQLKEHQKHLILSTNRSTNVADDQSSSHANADAINVKYLSEKSSISGESKTSEDWEKMTDSESIPPTKENQSSDEDREWVKCD
ncbi:hypothetical protein RDWZM_008420 [Blomia tropicalis]|uniref:BSD domain-containing protein n=1 Tax=Blomia tropicalis TaxID=40697 RepID=A0A9Q0LZB8_BLOTA|nr:hypothetical protein RDWZM_008420 [Blomia tropicalis]